MTCSHRLELRTHLREQRHERVLDDHDAVLGVVGDVRELLGKEADVERVQHRAHRGHREVRLEMLLRVPAEGRDAIAGGDAEPRERRRQALGTLGDVGEARVTRVVVRAGRDRALRMHRPSVREEVGDGEGVILHRRAHGASRSQPAA